MNNQNHIVTSPRTKTTQQPWIEPSFKRCMNEYNSTNKFIKEKSAAIDVLLEHIENKTFPKWFKKTNYKPPTNKKFSVDLKDWDSFNNEHDHTVLKDIAIQYKAEMDKATTMNTCLYHVTNLKAELEATAHAVFSEPNPNNDQERIILPDTVEKINTEITAAINTFELLYNEKIWKIRLQILEEKKKKDLEAQKLLTTRDNMEITEISPAMTNMINKMVDLKLKKIKAGPPPRSGQINNPKPKPNTKAWHNTKTNTKAGYQLGRDSTRNTPLFPKKNVTGNPSTATYRPIGNKPQNKKPPNRPPPKKLPPKKRPDSRISNKRDSNYLPLN